ncbi:class A beta-lactamase [Streptomyces seoulensis]
MTTENHRSAPPTDEAPVPPPRTAGRRTRRTVLAGGLAGIGAALTGCGTDRPPPAASTSARTAASGRTRAETELTELERRFGGRVGVYAVDTGTGEEVRHRADERFLMCSTHKALTVAAVLRAHQDRPGLLNQVIHYRRADLLDHAPVTSRHVGEGMTVAALCRAAVTRSDNTAANLLLRTVGGPAAVTRFVRTLGDPVTRFDRDEPHVNEADGVLDTTTPAHFGASVRALTLGDALEPRGREQLLAWLDANTTGDRAIRAGCPKGWRIGDKTGSGNHAESNDIAVIRPPRHAPLVLAVFTAPDDPKSTTGQHTIVEAARIVTTALVLRT